MKLILKKVIYFVLLCNSCSGLLIAQSKVKPAMDSKTNPTGNSKGITMIMLREIESAKKSANVFKGGTSGFYNGRSVEWVLRAVSKKARAEYMDKQKVFNELDKTKINTALDELNTICQSKLVLLKMDDKLFASHDKEIEKLMQDDIKDKASVKIHKIGLFHSDWQVKTNAKGVPIFRYKHAQMWIRNSSNDHPYCYGLFYNFQQDYNGGTYGSTKIASSKQELHGCP